ncbi:non-ribosomal peptide synthetase, partial [Frankia nepalensis]|uniref:non-ribosomal peptide synthetase n=1 Tax=Frankia nepalensis TaxID=1836974 RepID=UPI001933EF74|nr:amino acid adenylation domain-containing protein [Frankia nepalensis]
STPSAPRPTRAAREPGERIPLSPAQRRLWLVDRFAEGTNAYNYPLVIELAGQVDLAALAAAVGDVIDRHEILRTVIAEHDGEPYQLVGDPGAVRPEVTALDCAPEQVTERVRAAASAPFDLRTDPPLRLTVLRPGPASTVLVIVLHHIATDEWSDRPFLLDLDAAYAARLAGRAPSLPPLAVQYADYTRWQRELLGDPADPGSRAARQLGFWAEALAGLPDEIPLPLDRPRPPVRAGAGGRETRELPVATVAALRALCARTGTSMSMLAHAAVAALLHRLGAGDDIPVGVPIAGRTDEALEPLVGFFVNTLVPRSDLSGDPTFVELLARTRRADLAAFDHQDVPFEDVVAALNPRRVAGRNPLFQVMAGYHHLTDDDRRLFGLPASWPDPDFHVVKFDLDITFVDRAARDQVTVLVEYALDVLDAPTAARIADRLVALLDAAGADPDRPVSRLPLVGAGERAAALAAATGAVLDASPADASPAGVPELLALAAAAHPERVALVTGGRRLTFGELAAQANRLARLLADPAAGRAGGLAAGEAGEPVVALALPRELMVPAIFGALAAGAAYLPLDHDQPEERLAFLLADAAPAVVVTTTELAGRLPAATDAVTVLLDEAETRTRLAALPGTPPDLPSAAATGGPPAGAAYVLYTSGSTGRPKAVVGTHGGLANLFAAQRADVIDPASRAAGGSVLRVAHAAPFGFDASWEPLLWLLAGHELHVVDEATLRDPAVFAGYVTTERVEVVDVTPSYLAELARHGFLEPGTHRPSVLVVGGEATPAALWERLRALDGTAVHNLYGPTEYTVDAYGWHSAGRPGAADPPGTPAEWAAPVANTRVYVLDAALEPAPDGVPGELYLAGGGLARGYLRRPGLTAARFVPDPFGEPGARMYRTGDRARRRGDGTLELLGRADDQLKLRGLRIEPGEIENVLAEHPDVAAAAVVAREDAPGAARLVAYVVPATVLAGEAAGAAGAGDAAAAVDLAALRAHVAARLPAYLVPAAFVALPELPRTVNGKLDRAALPAPDASPRPAGRRARPGREQLLAELFAEVLGVAEVGVDDDFFALGGHSLLVMRLRGRIRTVLGVDVAPRAVFDAPTVAGLVGQLDATRAAWPALAADPGQPDPGQPAPLSWAQRRMWVLGQVAGPSPAYNIPITWRLTGPLDVDALRLAVSDVVGRHEVLRTVFPAPDGDPVGRVVAAAEARVPFVVEDVEPDRPDALAHRLAAAAAHPFDLETEIPVRVTVLRLGPALRVVQFLVHHIAADEGSDRPFARDLTAAYRARAAGHAPRWAPPPLTYADYARWQRALLGDERDADSRAARQREFWRRTLAGLPEELSLPTDRPRPAQPSHAGGVVERTWDPELVAGLRALAREHGVTVFMVLRAAVAALLHRLGAGDDIPLGSPVAGRVDERLEGVVGLFLNTLVLRTDLSGDPTFAELLARVRAVDLAALDHQDLPFDRVVDAVNPPRSLARHPLFQVMVVYLPASDAAGELDLPGVAASPEPVRTDTAKFDLSFDFVEHPFVEHPTAEHPTAEDPSVGHAGADGKAAGLTVGIAYSADLFDPETVEALAGRLRQLVEAALAGPGTRIGSLPVLDPAERARVLVDFNRTDRDVVELTWPAAFEATARRLPDAAAVVCEDVALTYAELDARANRLARLLAARGTRRGDVVAVAVGRSVDLVVALLGVLKAGAAYLPIDLDHPAHRVAFMLSDAGARLVLSTTDRAAELSTLAAGDSEAGPGARADDDGDSGHANANANAKANAVSVAADGVGADGGGGAAERDRAGRRLVLLDDPATVAALASHDPASPGPGTAELCLDDAAYVIYTSGSTGQPKGVVVTHEGIGSLVATAVDRLGVDERSRVAQFASVGFDVTVFDLCMALCVGGCSVIVPEGRRVAGPELTDYLVEHGATHMILPPSLVAALPPGCALPAGGVLVVGTEMVPTETVRRWARDLRVVAAYGLTEATVNSTLWAADPDWRGPVPIGVPDPNTRAYVLDPALRPVGVGVVGELYVGGRGLARGYHGRAGLTASRFVADPFGPPGARLYRTGDRARWRARTSQITTSQITTSQIDFVDPAGTPFVDPAGTPGVLDFLGRADDQIKIRGFRIEPGEVQAALMRHPDVRQAAVLAVADASGARRLVAYAVPEGAGLDPAAVRAHAAEHLPEYMVPAAVVAVPGRLPLTPNGKLDRAALPAVDLAAGAAGRAPATELEARLCALFAAALGLPRIGADDDFFALGGDSIVAMRLVSRLRADGFPLAARELFRHRTPAELAAALEARAAANGRGAGRRPADGARAGALPNGDVPAGGDGLLGDGGLTSDGSLNGDDGPGGGGVRTASGAATGAGFDGGDDEGTGLAAATPALRALRDEGGGVDGFSSPVLLQAPAGLDLDTLVAVLRALADRHDLLRARLVRAGGAGGAGREPDWLLDVAPPGSADVHSWARRVDVRGLAGTSGGERRLAAIIAAHARAADAELDPDRGVLVRCVWFDAGAGGPGRLLLLVHHLVVDGVSWQVLLADVAEAAAAVAAGREPRLAPVPTSYRRWAGRLAERALAPDVESQLPFWTRLLAQGTSLPRPPGDPDRGEPRGGAYAGGAHVDGGPGDRGPGDGEPGGGEPGGPVSVTLTGPRAADLLAAVPAAFGARVDEVLLTALSLAVADCRRRWLAGQASDEPGVSGVLVALQGHGRHEHLVDDLDLSRTVGWFAEVVPVWLGHDAVELGSAPASAGGASRGDAFTGAAVQDRLAPDQAGPDHAGPARVGPDHAALAAAVARTRALLAAVPDGGTGYSLLRYLNPRTAPVLAAAGRPAVYLNYEGRLTRPRPGDWDVAAEDEALFADWNADRPDPFGLTVLVRALDRADGTELVARWSSGPGGPPAAAVRELASAWVRALDALRAAAGVAGR